MLIFSHDANFLSCNQLSFVRCVSSGLRALGEIWLTAGSRAVTLYGQHGNALHHSLVLENQELALMRQWTFECKFMCSVGTI